MKIQEKNNSMISERINPKLILLLGVIGVSFSSIFIKISNAPSMVIAAYRLGWTVLILLPVVILKYRNELKVLSKKDILWSFLSGFFLAIHFSVWFESLKYTSIASATVLVCTEVIFAAVGYKFIFKGKISKWGILSIILALIGSVIIAADDFSSSKYELIGDSLALIGAIMVAVYTLIGRKQRESLSTVVYTFLTYTSCLITLLIFNLATATSLIGYGTNEIVLGLLMGISCTILGHSLFSWSLKYLSPSYVSAVKLLEPVFASSLAFLLFYEIPGISQLAGGAIVIGSVYLYSISE